MQPAMPFWQGASGAGFYVLLSTNVVSGYHAAPPIVTIFTGPVTATPYGGVPPYTYQWLEDGAPSGIDIHTPTAATTTFKEYDVTASWSKVGNFYCRVTDSTAATADSGNCEATIEQTT